jgi:hypothetical protein
MKDDQGKTGNGQLESRATRDATSRIEGLEREVAAWKHYALNYGNATSVCETGYPQHPGYVCGRCGHDNSDGSPCPREATA